MKGMVAISSRRIKKDKKADAMAGFIVVIVGLIWISTGSFSSAITFLYTMIAIIISIGLILLMIRRNKLLKSGIAEIDKMSGRMFEQLLLEYFRKMGYWGKLTDEYEDYGADILLTKDNVKYVVQAKRWNQKVSVKAIQEIVASIKHYNADKGIVITNSYFTKNAENLARSNNIKLWDRNKLIDIMSKVQDQNLLKDVVHTKPADSATNICPRCGEKLVLRHGSRGKFIGCTGFPRCRFTMNYTG